jgi:hypothetical protein
MSCSLTKRDALRRRRLRVGKRERAREAREYYKAHQSEVRKTMRRLDALRRHQFNELEKSSPDAWWRKYANPIKIREKERKVGRAWYRKNKEKVKANVRKWRETHKEDVNEAKRRWRYYHDLR